MTDDTLHPSSRDFQQDENTPSLSEEDLFTLAIMWEANGQTHHTRRHFLENNLALLDPRTLSTIDAFATSSENRAHVEEVKRSLHRIITDAIFRGGTALAICDAYINELGGFALDIPVWLAEEISAIDVIKNQNSSQNVVKECAARWRGELDLDHLIVEAINGRGPT